MMFFPGCCCNTDCCACSFGGLQYGSDVDFNCPLRICLPNKVCLDFIFPIGEDCSAWTTSPLTPIRPFTLTWDCILGGWFSEFFTPFGVGSPKKWGLQCGYTPSNPTGFYTLVMSDDGLNGSTNVYISAVAALTSCDPLTLEYPFVQVSAGLEYICCGPFSTCVSPSDTTNIKAIVTEGECPSDTDPIQYYACLDGVCIPVVSGTEEDYDALWTEATCEGGC